ncbi:MAG: phosphoenolpyruvate synthase [Methermicoccaceae archaeon]
MAHNLLVVWLDEVDSDDVSLVGGKGASLGEMIRFELPVPGGFAVTAQAFRKFITETGIAEELFSTLDVDVDDNEQLKQAEERAKELILSVETPPDIKEEIVKYYEEFRKREGDDLFVAVRSSATAEDLPDASFAGQQETYLNIVGTEALLEAIRNCWASLYNARAIYYRIKQGFEHSKVDIAVIVQKMVNSEKAGVMFTSHPTTGEPITIIEGAWGLGESVVSGSVSPDNYVVDRKEKKIVSRTISTKTVMVVKEKGKTVTKKVPTKLREKNVLDDDEIMMLADYATLIEDHYGTPQDVEWGIEKNKIYILQSRPITTIKNDEGTVSKKGGEGIVKGIGASPGMVSGVVKIVHEMDDLGKVNEGDILVTEMTTPDMVPAMKRAAGIVTDEGGLTCHAAIVSRELGISAVVGTREGSKILKDGMVVTIDGDRGVVYEGKITADEVQQPEMVVRSKPATPLLTGTEVKVNISIAEAAARAASTNADGVGLLRVEHIILGLEMHPYLYIKEGRQDEYISELSRRIQIVADAFYPKPVWIRTLDAPTDEFRGMKGGEDEPHEPNPMLGWRGVRRDLDQTEHFKLEMAAIKNLIDKGYINLGVMLPLVQHPREVREAKRLMEEAGINLDKIDIGIMVETPAAAIIIEDFLAEGLDFISMGTNDLTQYTLAVDRNNENVAYLYDEMHPAILKLIETVIKACRKAGVKSSICGQAGSNPKMVSKLVEMGISSVSANIDAVDNVKEAVFRAERLLLLEKAREE